jgi:hypothetical protein
MHEASPLPKNALLDKFNSMGVANTKPKNYDNKKGIGRSD